MRIFNKIKRQFQFTPKSIAADLAEQYRRHKQSYNHLSDREIYKAILLERYKYPHNLDMRSKISQMSYMNNNLIDLTLAVLQFEFPMASEPHAVELCLIEIIDYFVTHMPSEYEKYSENYPKG